MTCPVCGAETAAGAFCEFCGSPLEATKEPVQAAAPTAATPTAAASAAPSSEAKCPVCGAPANPTDKACAFCGAMLGGTPASKPAQNAAKATPVAEPQGSDPKIEKTMDVTDKKCPNCGGTVVWDPESGMMACEFCGYKKELPKPEAGDIVEMDFKTAKIRASKDWGAVKKTVICQQCGGEAVYDGAETANTCPFCGSTSVMAVDDDKDVMAPGGVVPFSISSDKAAELFKKWIGGKLFAPNDAKKSCRAKDIHGIYLPYWTYDSDTDSTYTAMLGFDRKVKDKDGNTKTVTDWRPTRGMYQEFIDDQLIYASKKTVNNYIKSVSQFDFSKLTNYSPEIVAGFVAERYSVGLDEGWGLAQKEIANTLKSHLGDKLKRQHHADRVKDIKMSTNYSNITFKYLLAPIWLAAFKYNSKIYNIVINGQTGKIAGESPISKIKVAIAIAIVVAIIALLIFLSNM